MGFLDKFKKKKTDNEKAPDRKPTIKEKKIEETQTETVVTPDGQLKTVAKKSSAKPKKVKPKKEDTGHAYQVLIRPLITEKGSYLGANNQYVFEVSPMTNKIEVKKAIKKVYGVDPVKVNTIRMEGKEIRYGRTQGRTKHWKKAVITLPPNQKIEIQEGL
ncbi:50S ribosomal protein L23 [Patescibacteria group bacterium]|nr:50S ribosomal protein L23 [Patescibacteria group bacterium]MBU0963782.1 50S ribosomal protein L23 [Patescibacteria group bacterium]